MLRKDKIKNRAILDKTASEESCWETTALSALSAETEQPCPDDSEHIEEQET